MIQKLLLIIRLLFLKFSNSFFGKSFIPSAKLLFLGMFFVVNFGFAQKTWTGNNGTSWNDVGNWSPAGVPVSSDAVIIPSTTNAPIVSTTTTCSTITFTGNTGSLAVNSGVTLNTGAITVNSSISSSRDIFISGAGTIAAASITIGQSTTNPSSIVTTKLTSNISNLNLTGNILLNSTSATGTNNAIFNFESGTANISQIRTVNENLTNSNFSMATGAQSGTLLISNATAFNLSNTGTNTINLNGISSTVNYDGTAQAIYNTAYNNLIISGNGNKTASGSITVNKDFSLTGGTFLLNSSTTSNALTILGDYNQSSTGIFEFNSGTSGSSILNLAGNLNNTSTATASIKTTATVSNGVINFVGIGTQTINNGTAGASSYVNYTVNAGSTLQLLSNLTLTQSSQTTYVGTLTVNGTIDFGTFQVSQSGGSNSNPAKVLINAGAKVITANIGGINGSIPLTSNLTRTFNNAVSYIFNGTAAQITSTAMPSTVSSLSINNTSGVTLSQLTNITNDFSLSLGSTANLGNSVTHTAKTITLNGNGQNSGTWGSSGSVATNKSALYFGNTPSGIVNISTAACAIGYWTGVTSADWNLASNWCGAVPTAGVDVIIPSGTPFQPTIGASITANVRNLTINTGAGLTLSTSTSILNINGNFANSGSLSTVTGSTISFAGTAAQSIASFTTLGNIAMNKTGGVATFTGAVNGNALTINGGGGTLNLGTAFTHTFTGDITLTNGTLNGGSSILNANSSTSTAWAGTGTNFAAGTGTVNFGGVAQTIAATTTFNNLVLSGTGAKTITSAVTASNLTVTGIIATSNNTLTVSTALSGTGTLINSASGTLNLGGTATITTLTTTTAGNNVNYTGTVQTIVGNFYSNLTISNSGAKTLSAATTIIGNLTVANGSNLATNNFGLTLGGNFTNTGTFTAGSSPVTIGGTTNQSIAGFSTTGIISITKTAGVASFTSAFSTTGNLNMSSGSAIDLGSVATHTAGSLTLNGNGQNGGTWGGSAATSANKSATYFGSAATGIVTVNSSSCIDGYWTGTTSSDWNLGSNWCGGTVPTSATNVIIPAGTPNMPTISTGIIANTNTLTINASASLVLANSTTSLLNISGNFVNNGTFTAGVASTVSLVGANQSIPPVIFGNLTLAGTSTKTFPSTTVAIANNLVINSGVVSNLNTVTHTTKTLTIGGSGPLYNTWGNTASNPVAVNTANEYFSNTGRIQVTSSTSTDNSITNNYASFTNGNSGDMGTSVGENSGPLVLAAPIGTVFINVKFASYGKPTGTYPNYQVGTYCDAFSSRSVTTKFLGDTNIKIPDNGQAFNAVFGDPCVNVVKTYNLIATYAEPVCISPSSPAITIIGSIPSGGAASAPFTYLWKKTTTGATATDYVDASGTNNAVSYIVPAGSVTQTTWYKRIVTSGMYSSETIVIIPVNTAPIAPNTITAPVSVCAGSATTLAVSGGNKGGNGGYTQWFTGACGSAGVLIGTGDSISVTPTATTTYYARYINGCGSSTCLSVTVTTSVTITSSLTASSVCQSTTSLNSSLTYSATTGTPNRYNIVWNALPLNSFANVSDTALPATTSGSISISVPPNTLPGTYTGILTVKTAGNCSSFGNSFSITVNPTPATPTVGTITNVSCASLGSVVLSNLPSGNWTIAQTGFASASYSPIPGTSSYTVTGLAAGGYYFTVNNGTCTSTQTALVTIGDQPTVTWNGTTWIGGIPDATKKAIVTSVTPNQPFTANITACSLIITSPDPVIVSTGVTLKITNAVTSNGQLTFKNNSSLVQINNVTNSGDIYYERTSTPIFQKDYIYWSTPVTPQRLIDVSPLTTSTKYFGNDGLQWVQTDRLTNMVIGKGYIIRGPATYNNVTKQSYTALFKGVPNNGDLQGELLDAGKYYLIGNPYPSALSVDDLIDQNAILNGTIYLWTHNTPAKPTPTQQYTVDDYAAYNLSGGVSAKSDKDYNSNPVLDGGRKPTGFIAAGQAFYISVLPGPGGKVSFNNSMRPVGVNGDFFRSSNASKTAAIEKHRIWLNMTNESGAFKQVLVGYIQGATNEYDTKYDGISFDANPYLDFYSLNNNDKYIIQGRALPFIQSDIIPLGYRTTTESDFTISIDEVDGSMNNQKIYLEDKAKGIVHDLTTSNYTFKTAVGTFTDRFVLRYTNKTLGTGDFENLENGIVISVKNKVISIVSSKENIKEIAIFDITGKTLYSKNKVSNTELLIQNLPSSNQVLLVKVTLENDFTTTRKIIFQ